MTLSEPLALFSDEISAYLHTFESLPDILVKGGKPSRGSDQLLGTEEGLVQQEKHCGGLQVTRYQLQAERQPLHPNAGQAAGVHLFPVHEEE